ncbi:hypothetical protein EXIGLDRAFT_837478 [Exidia glandulosa HHB12029]|uniref:Uncharacterized protein n=1 Tax=Exidia glandulosa HHB12029 TaxID=1314781 RepID=A0A165GRH9_EXIGL|nr:hypothetical protein EXIGLDRAFT_837478 [Exidia glandulosa HHB12029]
MTTPPEAAAHARSDALAAAVRLASAHHGGIQLPISALPGLQTVSGFQAAPPPPPFDAAPQRLDIEKFVVDGVLTINQIIKLLRDEYPQGNANDIVDKNYTVETVQRFKLDAQRVTSCFESAHQKSSEWFTQLGNVISLNIVEQARLKAKEDDGKKKMHEIQAQLPFIMQQVQTMNATVSTDAAQVQETQQQLAKAQHDLDAKRAEQKRIKTATLALIWIPVVAATLAAVNATAEENAVKSAQSATNARQQEVQREQEMLLAAQKQLADVQVQLSQAHAEEAGLEAQAVALLAQEREMETTNRQLQAVQEKVVDCTKTLASALGSATTVDNMMSMQNVSTAIKGLVDALKSDSAFQGDLAALDANGFKDLDAKIALIKKSATKFNI